MSPNRIRPVHEIEKNTPGIFDDGGYNAVGLSALQISLLNDRESQLFLKKNANSKNIEMLYDIWSKQDELQSDVIKTATEHRNNEGFLIIPDSISDNELLRLKTDGMVVGDGRKVTLTKNGDRALKDHILSTKSSFFLNRKKELSDAAVEGDIINNKNVASANKKHKSKFTRIPHNR